MATSTTTFEGFRPEAVEFLAELAQNNDRVWFQPRKAEYERLLKEPLEQLCAALDERFVLAGMPLSADPAHSPFRIYRDVRFSKDKSPYKTNVGASFPYVERGPMARARPPSGGVAATSTSRPVRSTWVAGCGTRSRPASRPGARLVADDPDRVHAAAEDPKFVARFGGLDGERLTRVPKGFAKDHPDADLLTLKDVTFGRRLGDDEAFGPDLPDRLADDLSTAVPIFRLLAGLAT